MDIQAQEFKKGDKLYTLDFKTNGINEVEIIEEYPKFSGYYIVLINGQVKDKYGKNLFKTKAEVYQYEIQIREKSARNFLTQYNEEMAGIRFYQNEIAKLKESEAGE